MARRVRRSRSGGRHARRDQLAPIVGAVGHGVRSGQRQLGRERRGDARSRLSCMVTRSLTRRRATNHLSQADFITGMVFPSGTRTVLFFGKHGMGNYCYGTGGSSGGDCFDPDDSSKGIHSYPYRSQVWAYDANDLIAVKNGQKLSARDRPARGVAARRGVQGHPGRWLRSGDTAPLHLARLRGQHEAVDQRITRSSCGGERLTLCQL